MKTLDEKISQSKSYYDRWTKKFVTDYLTGNNRTEAAIKFAKDWIPGSEGKIIDIGCGIGWSTHEFASANPGHELMGVDLSTNSIEAAQHLFKRDNLSYHQQDVTADESVFKGKKFDAIIMLDVYEHIPVEARENFHSSIAELLNDEGRLILTFPSKYHQEWLEKDNPEGLQPVDEKITVKEIYKIMNDIDGELLYYNFNDNANTFDYLHVVIQKGISFDHIEYSRKYRRFVEPDGKRLNRIRGSRYSEFIGDGFSLKNRLQRKYNETKRYIYKTIYNK